MKVTNYECVLCGKRAFWGYKAKMPNSDPEKQVIVLECREKDHPDWTVEEYCSKCGKVPEYRSAGHEKWDSESLLCLYCHRKWRPKELRNNPFYDERAI